MTTTTGPTRDERIARFFLMGNSADLICEQGVTSGWARADVLRVAAERGWELDPDGRIPLHLRAGPQQARAARPSPRPTAPADLRRVQTAGGPYVTALRAGDLFVDYSYQRPLDQARVTRMSRTWQPRMLGVLEVSDRGPRHTPRYAIVNGQHRCAAAMDSSPNGEDLWVPCTVHEGLDPAGEALLMFELDNGTKPLTSWDKWRSRRAAGDTDVLAVETIAHRHGMTVQPGSFGAVGAAEKLLTQGGVDLLGAVVGVLVTAYGPNPEAMKAPQLASVGRLFQRNGADLNVPRLVQALQKIPPHQLRASADALRQAGGGTLSANMAHVIAGQYNRLPGARIDSGRAF